MLELAPAGLALLGASCFMHIQENVPLAPLTTFHVGGNADFFVVAAAVSEVREAVSSAKENNVPVTILAGGSNVLVSDSGVRGLVIKIEIAGISLEEETDVNVVVVAGAGEMFDALVHHTVANGWWGLENLSAIPGSVGATPVQNVGAYGVEVKNLIEWVEVFDTETDAVKKMSPRECSFGYRDSIFKHAEGKRYIILRVAYRLSKKPKPLLAYRDLAEWFKGRAEAPKLEEIRAAVMRIRSRKFPDWRTVGTAGSFFKNPIISQEAFAALTETYPDLPGFPVDTERIKVSLGWILDKLLHLRGHTEGSVGTYENQALVVVTHGDATSCDIDMFAEKIAERVFEKTNIRIEKEVTNVQ